MNILGHPTSFTQDFVHVTVTIVHFFDLFFFFFFFLWHMEVPRQGGQIEAVAASLCHSSWQCQNRAASATHTTAHSNNRSLTH